ncbi:MAG: hypothetical protein IIA65_02600 [Planctomycetes bacterium]|nr:hypothetical protein [Planctomycetota bacterium]
MQLTEKDKRTLKIGAACLVAMVMAVYMPRWLNHWRDLRRSIHQSETLLQDAAQGTGPKQTALLAIVPTFKMPEAEEKQKFLFRDRMSTLIKKSGIKAEPLQLDSKGKRRGSGYQRLLLHVKGKCKFGQLLDFLVSLKTNPYFVGIETLKIDCDPKKPSKNRGDIDIELVLSTYAK